MGRVDFSFPLFFRTKSDRVLEQKISKLTEGRGGGGGGGSLCVDDGTILEKKIAPLHSLLDATSYNIGYIWH